MKVFYFTATGNSLYVARKFAGATLMSMPAVLRSGQRTFEDDAIGLVFPIYALAAPRTVRDFVQQVSLKSGYTFAVMTYGNMPGDCCGWFHRFASQNGLSLDYANHILMGDNYLPFFDAGKQLAKDTGVDANAEALVRDVAAKRRYVNRSGIVKRLLTGTVQLFWRRILGISAKFRVSDACTACRICAGVCPNRNVELRNGKPTFADRCESCLACINLCPAKAITLKREKNPNKRYRHPAVAVADIVKANSIV